MNTSKDQLVEPYNRTDQCHLVEEENTLDSSAIWELFMVENFKYEIY